MLRVDLNVKQLKNNKMSEILDGNTGGDSDAPGTLPNATASLVLGIISLATFWIYGIPGIVCGIIALALHGKDKRMYNENPAKYSQSFKTSKAGMVCGLLGLIFSAVFLLLVILFVVYVTNTVGNAFR